MTREICGIADGGVSRMAELRDVFISLRIPSSGGIDLTARCNLRCLHCYHGGGASPGAGNELTTDEWLSILDQIAEAGCLNLLITGGEPLLRGDFDVLYEKARSLGMLVTVFTNGTLIAPDVIDLFKELPPLMVEISLYGASEDVYEGITGVPGSFRRCLSGIDDLLEAGVEVGLKTVLLTGNVRDLANMRKMARERAVDFRLDYAVFPRLNGDRSPLDYRVPPREAVRRELEDPQRRRLIRDSLEKVKGLPVEDRRLYACGAGKTSFHIDAAGRLVPCLMMAEPAWDLRKGSFEKGWSTAMTLLEGIEASDNYRCGSCDKRHVCGICPAFSSLEQGSPEAASPYLCAIGEERCREVQKGIDYKEDIG